MSKITICWQKCLSLICLVLIIIVPAASKAISSELSGDGIASKTQADGPMVSNLSPAAREISDLAGITLILNQLDSEQKSVVASELSLQELAKRQKILYLRTKVNALVEAINLQIDAALGRVESTVAQTEELHAYIAEERNRMTHRTNQINLISGGVTKIVGYSIALAPITTIPTNVLEVFDGAVQSGLSAMSLRQQQQEKKMEQGVPPILESFLNNTPKIDQYPPGVSIYMNHVPPGSNTNKSRRQSLIEGWQSTGILARSNQTQVLTKTKQSMRMEALDRHLAMLSELKSHISEMHNGLMELSNSIALSYSVDPIWQK